MTRSYLVPIVLLAACSSTGTITVSNYSLRPVHVAINATDSGENIVLDRAVKLEPGAKKLDKDGKALMRDDGTPQVTPTEWHDSYTLPRKSKVKITYTPVGTQAKFNEPAAPVPNASSFSKSFAFDSARDFDSAATVDQLKALGEQIGGDNNVKDLLKLVDIEPMLTSLLIGKVDVKGRFQGQVISLGPPPKLAGRQADTVRNVTMMNRAIAMDVKVAVPIFGSIATQLSNSDFYKVLSEVRHYQYANTYSIADALQKASKEKLAELQMALKNDTSAQAYYIQEMHVIPMAAFSITRGTEIKGSADAAIASVLTSSGAYTFSQSDENLVGLEGDVVNIKYAPYGKHDDLLTAVNDLLKGKQPKEQLALQPIPLDLKPDALQTLMRAHQSMSKTR